MDLIETQLDNPIEHWYYRHKYWAIRKQIIKRRIALTEILDIGAGSALFSLELQKEFPGTRILAIDPGYSDRQIEMSDSKIQYSRENHSNKADLILLTDVLEHVPDDVEFLSNYVVNTSSNPTFIITVPAFMSLWSNHDVYLKHFRRYRRGHLGEVLSKSGLEVLEITYLYSLLFPVAYIKRKAFSGKTHQSDLKKDSLIIQRMLNGILIMDRFFSRFLPFGVSVLAIAIKREANVEES